MPFTDVDLSGNKCVQPCSGNATPGLQIWQPGQTTTVKLTFNSSPVAQTLEYKVPGLGIDKTVSIAAGVGSYTIPSGVLRAPPNGAGDYPITWTVTNASTSCSGTLHFVDIPYFAVYNGDVSAGGTFGACATTGGTLASWYDSSGSHSGASTLLSALSTGTINGFASSQDTGGGPPGGGGNTLTFANSGGIGGTSPSAAFGGAYAGAQCLFTPTDPAAANLASGNYSIAPTDTGGYKYTGALNLGAGPANSALNPGNNLALYVTGNVYIGSNVVYGTDAGGVWTINTDGTTDVPSFVLVADGGNIYIDPNVTQLDGIYVAETKSGAGGTIYTCGTSAFAPETAANLYGCNKQLTVHGSFIADQVNLMRTMGTLADSAPGDSPWRGSTTNCTNGLSLPTCAAEVFNFSPEMYLSTPEIQPPNNGAVNYDDIATLPPVL